MEKDKVNKKKLRALQTRERLLAAATLRFGADGYSGCSLDVIAADAGITKGAVYVHFASKADVFVAIIERAFNRAMEKAEEFTGRMSCLDSIIALLWECFANPSFPVDHKLWTQILAVANRDSEVKKIFLNHHDKFRRLIERWLEEGAASGEIRAGIDAAAVANLLFVIGAGLIVRPEEETPGEEFFKIFEDSALELLRP